MSSRHITCPGMYASSLPIPFKTVRITYFITCSSFAGGTNKKGLSKFFESPVLTQTAHYFFHSELFVLYIILLSLALLWDLFIVLYEVLSQLKRLYEKSWEELPGNCDTLIYLGGKDQFTNEYLSKELGKETIDTLAINKTKSKQGSTSYNDGILGRELATIDELSTMDNNDCIVMVRGLHPFMTAKFDITNHPRYSMLDEADKANNTYYLEENINTVRETEYVDFTKFYDNEIASPDSTIEIG